LDSHTGLLSGGPARPGRHRSLEALVAWSFELLDDAERRLLARLSVLRGGFELDTAERVAGGGPLAPQLVAAIAGDDPAAAAAIAETRAALSGRHEAITQATLTYAEGIMAWHRGELADAERLIRTATLQWHHCSDRIDAADGIELLGVLAFARERYGDAARLLAAANAARLRLGYLTPGFAADRRAATRAASRARHALGEDGFTQAGEQGQRLTLDDAVAYIARRGGGRKRPAAGWASLTPTELQVARLVAEGLRTTPSPGACSSPPAQSKCTSPTSSPS
jgi:hypothetical protein